MAKILLVEDDVNLREIYAARLGAEGFEVVAAADGEEALAKSVREKPDLILLDIMMPKISGFDVLDILRSTPQVKNTKVVMLTALSQKTDRQRGEQLGVDRYLIKSQITLEDVVHTIQEVLGQPETPDTAEPAVDESKAAKDIESVVETLPKPQIELEQRPHLDDQARPGKSATTDKSTRDTAKE
ncbi:response regulator [Candidatus Microgenomates bacterium]|nr:response regulator [Candidatus Microgenomates bacterium]